MKKEYLFYAFAFIAVCGNELAIKYGAHVCTFPATMIIMALFLLFPRAKETDQ